VASTLTEAHGPASSTVGDPSLGWLRYLAEVVPLQYFADPSQALSAAANRWNERHRSWHGPAHLTDLVDRIVRIEMGHAREVLLLAALFHDVVYDPTSSTNEEESAEYLLRAVVDPQQPAVREAADIILASKWTRQPPGELARRFFALDTRQLGSEVTLAERLAYERAIFREYQWVPWPVYREKRGKFLKGWAVQFPEHKQGVAECLQLLEALAPRVAVYPGSFNPFHLGHLSVLRQAEQSFDKVIVAVGINRQKAGSAEAMEQRHDALRAQLKFHEVRAFDGLLSEFIDQLGHPVSVVRGVRDGTDLEAELRFARFLGELRPRTSVVWIGCEPEYQHLSSSAIRELESFRPGAGSRYVPAAPAIYNYSPGC